jgi:probable rRNA maturation factor
MIRISIACPQDIVPIDRPRMRKAARVVIEGEGLRQAQISLAFVDNATIQALNRQFLNHDRRTDVLSFPLSEGGSVLSGELVIGAEVAQAQSVERGHDIQAELALYVIHGLLHLCGYEDRSASAAKKMSRRERYYLKVLGLPDIAPRR